MKGNLKWLLLIPVFAVAISLGYLIPTLLLSDDSGDENTSTTKAQSQVLQSQLDDINQRITAYQALLQRNPNDIDAMKGIGDSYLEMGAYQGEAGEVNESYRSYKNAVDQYRKYLSIKPDGVETRIDLGLAYSYLQMIDISLRELNAATAADPANQRGWHSLGWVLYNSAGNVTDARVAWQKSYDLNPNTPIGVESKTFLDQFTTSQISVPQASGIEP
ncbi:MAG: tetratricopeptide repeat protein [Thermoleophilia bacterium]|nr:tetratricopeptide repeat protein [Thermoleophilia bacterium]